MAAKEKQADFLQNSGKAQKLKKPGTEEDGLMWELEGEGVFERLHKILPSTPYNQGRRPVICS